MALPHVMNLAWRRGLSEPRLGSRFEPQLSSYRVVAFLILTSLCQPPDKFLEPACQLPPANRKLCFTRVQRSSSFSMAPMISGEKRANSTPRNDQSIHTFRSHSQYSHKRITLLIYNKTTLCLHKQFALCQTRFRIDLISATFINFSHYITS